MAKSKYYHYFVEGETERKLIDILKTEYQVIEPGKIDIFNVVEEEISIRRTMGLKRGTMVILVFDTDTNNIGYLEKNIAFLKKQSNIYKVICLMQVKNLEDELIKSCNIREIKELTRSRTNSDFKRDMLRQNNFKNKLV